MKIDFASKPLCTGKGTDSPKDFSYVGERSEQVSRFLRGAQAVVRDRGNRYTTIGFEIFRSHGTIQAAQKFCLSHQDSFPSYGLLVLTCDDGSGLLTQVMYLPNAFLKSVRVRYEGMLSFTNYVFTGGALSATKPS